MNKLIILALLSTNALADPLFNTQVKLLTEKSELCIRTKDSDSEFCKDYRQYSTYVFKGKSEVWANYHIDKGNIDGKNIKEVTRMMELANEALSLGKK